MKCPDCKKEGLEIDALEENVICSNCGFTSELFELEEGN